MSAEGDHPQNNPRSDWRLAWFGLLVFGSLAINEAFKRPADLPPPATPRPKPAEDLIARLDRKEADRKARWRTYAQRATLQRLWQPNRWATCSRPGSTSPLRVGAATPAAAKTAYLSYVNKVVGFTAEFPVDAGGEAVLRESVEAKMVTLVLSRKGAEFAVWYDSDTAAQPIKPEAAAGVLEELANFILKREGELIESNAATAGEGGTRCPARDFSYKRGDGAVVRNRFAVVAGRLCGVSTSTADGPAAVRFLKSFKPVE